ncbi:MAG: DNA gyrase subunit A [Eubacterium sp.]|nr:DNA gyrase subunit A [Eubacterium sp.]
MSDDNTFDKIHDDVKEVDLKKTMENSYIDYAMSVIASRALPDVRDGLKPVQRRILFSMIELNNGPDKPHRKCARIVGDTMGKYHPHGDSSIYDALVKLAQPWNTRYPLVDGHGNFGSMDGDGAAAMRYTEARLTKISMEMLADINKDTVDFIPNFDETEKEPVVLPSRYPNLLVNGTTGIAVGMATNIPPHNLREVIGAVVRMIDNRIEDKTTSIEELMEIVQGPDFPTGAEILGRRGIEEAYRTGRGKIKVRAISEIEPMAKGKQRIVITEIPYMVNKALLIQKIADLVKTKRVDGITDLRDESSREGMRIVIELRHDVNANLLLNNLYKHTQLEDTFGVNMLALVDNQPRVLSLPDMLKYYIRHQEDVVTRRTKFELAAAEKRAHIVEGLLIAIDNIDEVIKMIRAAANVNEAKEKLMERFDLTDAQAQAIVDMRLRALTGLERDKLEAEYKELQEKIAYFKSILADEKMLLSVIRDEIQLIADKYGDDRRTRIGQAVDDFTDEDLIDDEPAVLTMTHFGYIKRMSVDNFHAQNRGGKGIRGIQTIEDDFIEDLLMTTTLNSIMFFTNKGRAFKLKTYQIPEAGRTARGVAMVNLLQLESDEHVSAVVPIRDFTENKYFIMVTKKGIIKKTPQMDFKNIRKTGIIGISLRDDDELIEVKTTDNKRDIFMVTRNGMCIRFKDTDIRSTGRNSIGVIGMNIDQGDEVVGMQMNTQGSQLLIVTENGMGKRTNIEDFHVQRRGGKGLKCYKITEKTGNVVGVKAVNSDHEIMLITNEGIIIQLRCDEISTYGRVTSGVKLINLKEGVVVAQIAKVRQTEKVTADEGGEVTDEGAEVVDEVSENESTEEAVDEVTEEIAENTENEETE